jgi:hypothetical protein
MAQLSRDHMLGPPDPSTFWNLLGWSELRVQTIGETGRPIERAASGVPLLQNDTSQQMVD